MRSLLHLALVLVALVVAVSAALDEFPKRTKTAQGSVDLNVKRVLRSRQLTRDQLVARTKLKATRKRDGPPRTSPMPPPPPPPKGQPFTIIDSNLKQYTLDPSTGNLVSTSSTTLQFQTSAVGSGTVAATSGSILGSLGFVPNVDGNNDPPNVVTASSVSGRSTLTCSTTDRVSGTNNQFDLDCTYTPSGGSPATVYFCTQSSGGSIVYASVRTCRNGFSSLPLIARF